MRAPVIFIWLRDFFYFLPFWSLTSGRKEMRSKEKKCVVKIFEIMSGGSHTWYRREKYSFTHRDETSLISASRYANLISFLAALRFARVTIRFAARTCTPFASLHWYNWTGICMERCARDINRDISLSPPPPRGRRKRKKKTTNYLWEKIIFTYIRCIDHPFLFPYTRRMRNVFMCIHTVYVPPRLCLRYAV